MKVRCVLLIVCLLLLLSACDKRPKVILKSEGELTARVTWTKKNFTITNGNSFDWNYVLFGLNIDGRGSDSYLYVTRTVQKGETIKVKTEDFYHRTSRKRLDVNNIVLFTFSICEGNLYDGDAGAVQKFWRGIIYDYK